MKKHLFKTMAALSFMSFSVMAQPTITAAGVNPVVGDSYTLKSCSYVQPGNGGANETWDFTGAVATGSTSYTSANPSATPYASNFASSNFSMSSGTIVYSFWNATSSALQNTGSVVQGTIISYNNPEDVLRFPFTDGTTYTDNWGSTFTRNNITYVRTGTTTVTYSGYGTLKLPTGTYQNAVRVHFYQTYTDTYSSGTINYENDEYIWYVNGHHQAIAATYMFDNDISGPSSSAMYSMGTVTGINEAGSALSGVDVFPNPASNQISILASKELSLTKAELYDITGKMQLSEPLTVNTFEVDGTITLKIESFNSGIYFLKLISADGSTGTKKIIINH